MVLVKGAVTWLFAAALLLTACSRQGVGPTPSGDCPGTPVTAVVSIDQWGDITGNLGGDCARVTTVLTNPAIDPHDFEPTPADMVAFSGAQLVVVNGADYDTWAAKAVEASSGNPALVDAARVNRIVPGANPHLWYGPDYVTKTAAAITERLKTLSPQLTDYFDRRYRAWQESMKPYYQEIELIKSKASGKPYGATESVFDYMAQALELVDRTPSGYRRAAASDSEPAPGDILRFNTDLRDHRMAVLIFNSQTQGPMPDQIRREALDAGVPVVSVTESVPAGTTSFEAWQVGQLRELAKALGVRR